MSIQRPKIPETPVEMIGRIVEIILNNIAMEFQQGKFRQPIREDPQAHTPIYGLIDSG